MKADSGADPGRGALKGSREGVGRHGAVIAGPSKHTYNTVALGWVALRPPDPKVRGEIKDPNLVHIERGCRPVIGRG
jgi:hypothetical protein